MHNPIARWTKAPDGDVQEYRLRWTHNGAADAEDVVVPRASHQDNLGYTARFGDSHPDAVVSDGDSVSVTITVRDASGNDSEVVELVLDVPQFPPGPAANASLTLA